MKLWEEFTNDVIQYICKHNDRCVFLLLGNFAKEKMKIINNDNRCICGVHPSPLSANRGFLNSTIFRDLESWLGRKIHWAVDE
jgi:uracil-DNA glycosylase